MSHQRPAFVVLVIVVGLLFGNFFLWSEHRIDRTCVQSDTFNERFHFYSASHLDARV